MKLQWQDQTLRLRIDEAELSRLLDGRSIESVTVLPRGHRIVQRLQMGESAQPSIHVDEFDVVLRLPQATIREHAAQLPSKQGLHWQLDAGDCALNLSFEVDVRDSLRQRGARPRRSQ